MRRKTGKPREKNSCLAHNAPLMKQTYVLYLRSFEANRPLPRTPDEAARAAAHRVTSVVGENIGSLAKLIRHKGSQLRGDGWRCIGRGGHIGRRGIISPGVEGRAHGGRRDNRDSSLPLGGVTHWV
jgi:hypothetical protein